MHVHCPILSKPEGEPLSLLGTLQVTALEIQALKRINKGSQILLLDKNGAGPAKSVAKELSKLGFSKVFVITNGFSGWSQSKLQIRAPVRFPCCDAVWACLQRADSSTLQCSLGIPLAGKRRGGSHFGEP
jgi:hypothetical protein